MSDLASMEQRGNGLAARSEPQAGPVIELRDLSIASTSSISSVTFPWQPKRHEKQVSSVLWVLVLGLPQGQSVSAFYACAEQYFTYVSQRMAFYENQSWRTDTWKLALWIP